MATVVLCTLNARFIHASLGLRYLLANMGALRPETRLLEFVIQDRPADIVEQILQHNPRIVGLGVYIWNAEATSQVAALLKSLRPDITIIAGGPEVSYEWAQQPLKAWVDYVIAGQADVAFPAVCRDLLENKPDIPRLQEASPPALEAIQLPYDFYSPSDVANRVVYVEASRGCPFKCEFCLSALDKTAWPFPIEAFLAALDRLYARGARQFKFVDRTFNLKTDASVRILEFFLQRLDGKLFVHFELIPDRLPEALKSVITRFPPGALQFEIGVQTLNPMVQATISRKQDNATTLANLRWLRQATHAHLHTDLIVGLPGETLESFANGFDALVTLDPHEIQVGILKRLRGAPINRHTTEYNMRYSPHPPYSVLTTSTLEFPTLQRLTRFARYWDLIGNSGRFRHTRPVLLGDTPFLRFMTLSDWIYAREGKTHTIALSRLFDLLYIALTDVLQVDGSAATAVLSEDFARSGLKGIPAFLQHRKSPTAAASAGNGRQRQQRHIPNS